MFASKLNFSHERNRIMRLSLLLLLFAQTSTSIPATCDEPVGKSWMRATATSPLMVNLLGCGALAVEVTVDEKRCPGLYITTPTGGVAYRMGLQKGWVLLTLDGYAMSSPRVADDWMQRRPPKPLDYTYVVMEHGKPTIHSGRIAIDHINSLTATSTASGATSTKESSIDELEKYATDLINTSRRNEGKSELQTNQAFAKLARAYADYMLLHGTEYGFPLRRNPHVDLEGHIPMQRALQAGIMTEVHENLGMESRGSGSDTDLILKQHNMMMSEPAGQHNHRSILLDSDAHLLGVGVSRDKTHLFLVEEFGH